MPIDFEKLKNIVRERGSLLVLDGNDPTLVVLSYEHYQELENHAKGAATNELGHPDQVTSAEKDDTIEALNNEISALREAIRGSENGREVPEPQNIPEEEVPAPELS